MFKKKKEAKHGDYISLVHSATYCAKELCKLHYYRLVFNHIQASCPCKLW